MPGSLKAAITSDVDTLASIYKGQGCQNPSGYSYAEFAIGLENFFRFLEPYGAKATLFMVGNDFKIAKNQPVIRNAVEQGYEIGNHTLSHAQNFRLLTSAEKEAEIVGMEQVCREVAGVNPIGFRSPGWNISDDAIPILQRLGYQYDSSIFPTTLSPLLKLMHWYTMRKREAGDRTTLGQWNYMFAPNRPYRTGSQSFAQRGQTGLLEFPITVTPILRLPFFATFLLASGIELFSKSCQALVHAGYDIQFQFHLSDFVDYSHPDLVDQVPDGRAGQYVPQALFTSLKKKMKVFQRAMDILARHYTFTTLAGWATAVSKMGTVDPMQLTQKDL